MPHRIKCYERDASVRRSRWRAWDYYVRKGDQRKATWRWDIWTQRRAIQAEESPKTKAQGKENFIMLEEEQRGSCGWARNKRRWFGTRNQGREVIRASLWRPCRLRDCFPCVIGNHWDKESHRHHIREYRNIFFQSLAHGLYKGSRSQRQWLGLQWKWPSRGQWSGSEDTWKVELTCCACSLNAECES